MFDLVHKWVLQILSSLGLKRQLSSLFQALTMIVMTVPGLQIFAPFLQWIASWLGIAGIAHATLAGTVKVDCHTVTAFFAALLLAAQTNPELAVYLPVIKVIAYILGLFSSVQLFGNRNQ